ncbi:MAG: hypothetical protein WC958_05700 [Dehalococcoidales bacterium]
MNYSIFDNIMLEREQEELLSMVVEASRNIPREQRQKFSVIRINGGLDFLRHPCIRKEDNEIYFGDVEELARQGLVALDSTPRHTPIFDVTSLGFRYYEFLKTKRGEPVQHIETNIRKYLNSIAFRRKYPEALEKWELAEKLLWKSDTQKQITAIGHHCRETLQEFANYLVEYHKPLEVDHDKTRTIARLKAVLNSKKFSEAKHEVLNALIAYWGTTSDLIQRQVHGGNREGEPLAWEDARCVVFQTMVLMFEVDRVLHEND